MIFKRTDVLLLSLILSWLVIGVITFFSDDIEKYFLGWLLGHTFTVMSILYVRGDRDSSLYADKE